MKELKKKPSLSHNDYEEISEKRTSLLGYIFLILMAGFMIIISQTVFSDIESIPIPPQSPAYCVQEVITPYLNTATYYQECSFGPIDEEFQLDQKYRSIEPSLKELWEVNTQINTSRFTLEEKTQQLRFSQQDYDVSLQEKMALEEPILNKATIKTEIEKLQKEIQQLNAEKSELTTRQDLILKKLEPGLAELKTVYGQAQKKYERDLSIYSLITFLLKLLFVLPFFSFSLYYYLRLKKSNSPYTIILTAILAASGIVFLQITLVFLYEIIPHQLLEKIFEFFLSLPFLRYVLYYGSVILVILLFGGIVYYIQKKVFDPAKVALRRLKDNQCPSCSFRIQTTDHYCPSCGIELKTTCTHCEKLRNRFLPHCANCGK